MKVIVCLDDNKGLLFNNRRQSRDRLVTEDIIKNLNGEKLFILPFSEKLFEGFDNICCVDCDYFSNTLSDDTFFVENVSLSEFSNIDSVIIYKWNRVYPADFYCDIDFNEFSLIEESEFKGNSHEKITKQIYVKEEK